MAQGEPDQPGQHTPPEPQPARVRPRAQPAPATPDAHPTPATPDAQPAAVASQAHPTPATPEAQPAAVAPQAQPAGIAPALPATQAQPDPLAIGRSMADIAGLSRRLVSDWLRRQVLDPAQHSRSGESDPLGIGGAFMEMTARLMARPALAQGSLVQAGLVQAGRMHAGLVQAQLGFWQDYLTLWQNSGRRLWGLPAVPVIRPEPADPRFADPVWKHNEIFDFIKQSYLLSARYVQDVTGHVEGLSPRTAQKVDFYARQFVEAMSPSNFLLTSPEVLRRTAESGGENLLRGLNNLLMDLERGRGRLTTRLSELDAFRLGETVGVTPGRVVFQNRLVQLIQYAPTTARVLARPLMIVPPWTNKFYALDLRPRNSFVRWATAQGHTVFMLSWVNPVDDRDDAPAPDLPAPASRPAAPRPASGPAAPGPAAPGAAAPGAADSRPASPRQASPRRAARPGAAGTPEATPKTAPGDAAPHRRAGDDTERREAAGFEDYMRRGVLDSLDAIAGLTGASEVNAIGHGLGGTLLAVTLAWMARHDDRRIASATFLTTMLDFSEAGELGVFIDESQLASLARREPEAAPSDATPAPGPTTAPRAPGPPQARGRLAPANPQAPTHRQAPANPQASANPQAQPDPQRPAEPRAARPGAFHPWAPDPRPPVAPGPAEGTATFSMLRANDLIWSFVVNNYLIGSDPFPFDLLHWNSDAMRLPGRMHGFYLHRIYQANDLARPDALTLLGTPIDLGRIDLPTYVLAARDDHIAPWRSVYRGTAAPGTPAFGTPAPGTPTSGTTAHDTAPPGTPALGTATRGTPGLPGRRRFVLSAAGHLAGVVNPPDGGRYSHWINPEAPPDPQDWLAGAAEMAGSWWPDWQRWALAQDRRTVPARPVPDHGEPAPGSFVQVHAA